MTSFVVDALATYRLARLVVSDVLTFRWREGWIAAAYQRAGRRAEVEIMLGPFGSDAATWKDAALIEAERAPKLAYVVACPWCASIWLGAVVVLARRLVPRAWAPVATALAASAVAGLASGHEHD